MMDADFCVLVTTNVAYIGIDKSLISLQMRFNWPHDLLTYFQEQGRGSRQVDSKLICIVYGNLSSYISLVLQLVGGADGTLEDNVTSVCNGFNSAISPQRQVWQVNRSEFDYALRPFAKKQLQARMLL
jgi:hypothetical protein